MYCNKNWVNVVSLEGVKMSINILDHCSPRVTETTDLQIREDNCRNDVSSGVELIGKKKVCGQWTSFLTHCFVVFVHYSRWWVPLG